MDKLEYEYRKFQLELLLWMFDARGNRVNGDGESDHDREFLLRNV